MTTFHDPSGFERRPLPPKKEPWYENPWTYMIGTVAFIAMFVLLVLGLLIQGIAAIFCLALIFGKFTILELHTLEDVRDPFTN